MQPTPGSQPTERMQNGIPTTPIGTSLSKWQIAGGLLAIAAIALLLFYLVVAALAAAVGIHIPFSPFIGAPTAVVIATPSPTEVVSPTNLPDPTQTALPAAPTQYTGPVPFDGNGPPSIATAIVPIPTEEVLAPTEPSAPTPTSTPEPTAMPGDDPSKVYEVAFNGKIEFLSPGATAHEALSFVFSVPATGYYRVVGGTSSNEGGYYQVTIGPITERSGTYEVIIKDRGDNHVLRKFTLIVK